MLLVIIAVLKSRNSKGNKANKVNQDYVNSSYYQATQIPYNVLIADKGKYGEYSVYNSVRQYESTGAKFLFNLYIPKENGETTEIDLMMICQKGVFVFESKNYSGWIFGKENEIEWCQTLRKGKKDCQKNKFYNPIFQNRTHLKNLNLLLGNNIPLWSIVAFSDECTFKSVTVNSSDVRVVKCREVSAVVADVYYRYPNNVLNEIDIYNIYARLYPYTQVSDFTKAQHIANIKNNGSFQPIPQMPPAVIQSAPNNENKVNNEFSVDDNSTLAQQETEIENTNPAIVATLEENDNVTL